MPAFDFPNPPTPDQEVTNDATGVTYRYDAATQSWVIVTSQGASNIANDVAQLKTDVNTLESLLPLETSARQQGDADLQDQIDNLPDAFDPTPLNEALESEANTRQLADEDLQQQIDNIDVSDVDLSDYYNKTEVDDKDNALQIQIDDLTVTKGAAAVYTLNDIGIIVGIRQGDFYVDNTVAKNVKFMTFAPTDDNGNDRPLGAEGDIVELVGLNNRHYRYNITTAGEGVAGVDFVVAEDPNDLLIPGTTFQVYIYPQNSASASTEYVDAGLATKMSLTGNQEITPTWRVRETDHTYIRIQDQELSLFNVAYPTSDKHAANQQYVDDEVAKNQQYVDDEVAKYLPLTGGTLTDTLTIDSGNAGKIDLRGPGNCDIRRNGSFIVSLQESKIGVSKAVSLNNHQINNVAAPTSDTDAATKGYVDGLGEIYYGDIAPSGADVNNGDLWVDSGNMRLLMRAAGAWVNPDREADTESFRANANPNGRKFGFSSGTGAVSRKLNYFDSSGLKLRLSNTDYYGIKWNDGGIDEDVTMSNGPYFTIWEVVDDTNHKIIRQGRVSRIDYHTNDILCHLSSHRTNGSFSTSKEYWVTIGGVI